MTSLSISAIKQENSVISQVVPAFPHMLGLDIATNRFLREEWGNWSKQKQKKTSFNSVVGVQDTLSTQATV